MHNLADWYSMSLVTYSKHPHKAFAIPYSAEGTARCCPITDFQVFQSAGTEPGALTEILGGYDDAYLYLEIICHEDQEIQAGNPEGGAGVWKEGDMLEILFGGFTPYPWQQQYAVNAGGGVFSSREAAELQVRTAVAADKWTAFLRFPLAQFPLQNLSVGFAVARYAKSRGELSIWGNMTRAFHDVEDYGEIIFNDYNAAYLSKAGHMPVPLVSSRLDYEQRITAEAVPAQTVVHGPWLSCPSTDGMTVSFGTAGLCGAFVEYRPANAMAPLPWKRLAVKRCCGVISREHDFHSLRLEKLDPDTEYEYRAVTLTPVEEELEFSPVRRFRTFGENGQKNFSFIFFSDVHSNYGFLQNTLENMAVSDCEFLVSGGDCLSSANGAEALYSGLFDMLASCGKPVVFVRGNHEWRGAFTETGCRMMAGPDGEKTYYSFRCASTLFLVLDTGDDHPDDDIPTRTNADFLAAEENWLKDLVVSDEFAAAEHRIVLMHIPPYQLHDFGAGNSAQLLQILEPYKIDLVVSGHIHSLAEMKANSAKCRYLQTGTTEDAPRFSFPVIISSNEHALKITVSQDACHYEVI